MDTQDYLQAAKQALQTPADEYHLGELWVGLDKDHPNHYLPVVHAGEKVLDVGCGAGQTLIASCPYRTQGQGGLCVTCSRTDCPTWGYGIDVDAGAIRQGRVWSSRMVLERAGAERLPYPDREFDAVISRVALVYVDMLDAVSEIRRVLRPGGRIWFSLHPFAIVLEQIPRRNWKGACHLLYVAVNGLLFHFTLRTFRLAGRLEYWQTGSAMRRLLKRIGFKDICIERSRRILIVTAHL